MLNFTSQIQKKFQKNLNKEIAVAQAKYMKNKFAFYGIKLPLRNVLQKPFLVTNICQ